MKVCPKMGFVPNPIVMQNNSHNGKPENADMELVKALASQEGVDASHLVESSGLLEKLEELKVNRAERRERVLKLMPFIADELDTTDKIAKENLILLTIQTYRKRLDWSKEDNGEAVA